MHSPRPPRRTAPRRAAAAALVLAPFAVGALAAPLPAAPPPVAAAEYAARRERVAAELGPDALLVLTAPEPAPRNGDVTWPFRQDDDLFYLTGVAFPDTALVMVPGDGHRTVLFAPSSDPRTELWTGPVPTAAELSAASGIDEVAPRSELRPFLEAALSGGSWRQDGRYRYYRAPALPHFLEAVRAGRAELWLDLGPRSFDGEPLPPALRLAEEVRTRWPEVGIRDAAPPLWDLRQVKSPAEVALLQHAIDVTAEGIRAAMRRALTAERENQVQATLEQTFRDLGACCWGFPSIVGSGAHSTILHYEGGEGPVERGGLLLLDVGADVGGYTADVTRTFPADGTFSPDQRAIYQAVLDVSDAMLPAIRPGVLYADLHDQAIRRMGEKLLALGLIADNVPEQVTWYFPHGLGHPLGLAVHDVFDRTRVLEPGMVWTLEPGLYVRPDDVTASGTFAALPPAAQERIRTALDRYAGLGVRIEDDVLVTADAPRLLSGAAPRTVEAIEAALATP